MRIISTFLPAEDSAIADSNPTIVMAFDTLVDQKSHVVGITVGHVDGPDLADVRVSAIGQTIIERCCAHMARNYPQGVVVLAGVASVANAKDRVRKVLAKAPDKSFVLLVCADHKVYDAAFPAFYRVVWNRHVVEFSDLDSTGRARCMNVVACVEQVLRRELSPTKINLAAFGNMVPHLHWHVIARFDWDSHFPQPVWGSAQRQVDPPAAGRLPLALDALDARMAAALADFGPD